MNKGGLLRKIGYIFAIVALLLPLFALGKPSTGLIGQLRTKHKMGQASLGKLDPTSESMRLATLGLKGPASTILWLRADYYKEEKYFDRFAATLNQISLLQPHFVSVWDFQAHNLGYNVAPEFEDYRQRFEWVKKGIDYLVKGTKYNERKPILQYSIGQQYFGHKMGKADEKLQYRNLFSNDTEFHDYLKDQGLVGLDTSARGYDQKPDNWLTGRLWLNQATDLYEAGATIKKSPHLLYSYAPAWRMYYGEAIESEGILDASAALAWKQGGEEWSQFGKRALYQFSQGRDLTLLGNSSHSEELQKLSREYEGIANDAKASATEEMRRSLSQEERDLLDTPQSDVPSEKAEAYYMLRERSKPSAQLIASKLTPAKQSEALRLSAAMSQVSELARLTDSYRSQVNYDYWELRAKLEQKDEMIKARKLVYDADKLIDQADVKGALDLYEEAWVYWDWVFRRYPIMMSEEIGDDVFKSLNRYRKLLDQEIEPSFVLYDFWRIKSEGDNASPENLQLLSDMNDKAPTLSDDPPVFGKDKARAEPSKSEPTKPESQSTNASPEQSGTNQGKSNAADGSAKKEPVKSDTATANDKLKDGLRLPPTLENPGSQN
jgi:hypothetical protein